MKSPLIFSSQTRFARQRGVTLIEALVALMVMSFGIVALVGLMSNLRRSADLGKQRSEAMRLAQAELARQRSFSVLTKPTGAAATISDYDTDIVTPNPQPSAFTPDDSNTSYTVTRTVSPLIGGLAEPQAKTVHVAVSWIDRAKRDQEGAQQIVLDTVIARVDPAFAGSVAFSPAPGGIRQPANRHPAIPVSAKDLGNKSSVFVPSSLSGTVWVFNNVTGIITGVCMLQDVKLVADVTTSDVESCKNNTVGYLLSGTVRFSITNPANPTTPEASAIPLNLAILGDSYSTPRLDAAGHPVKDSNGQVIMDTVSVTPPTYQCFNDSSTGSPVAQPFVNYNCIVYPDTGPPRTWSGKLTLTGFNVGTTAADYRVCRYSADYNGNGSGNVTNSTAVDNYEHPALYLKVTGSLSRQNFLVVRGTAACPSAPAVNPTSGVFVDYSTIQLQP